MHLGKIIFIFCLSIPAAQANEPSPLESAQQFYNEAQWEKASEAYSAALQQMENLPPAFYYNYGTAAFRAGKTGEASVLLWKAYFDAPLDGDIRKNLQTIQEKLSPTARATRPATWFSWWPEELRNLPWQWWICCGLLALTPFLWIARKDKLSAYSWQWGFLALTFFGFMAGALTALETRMPVGGMRQATSVLAGPGKTFPVVASLESGALVSLDTEQNGWWKIRYLTPQLQETVGWIEKPTVLKLR